VGNWRVAAKDSPNFSLTLTPLLTWAGSTPTGAECSRPGISAGYRAPVGSVYDVIVVSACAIRNMSARA
jgi:hypothetical protein